MAYCGSSKVSTNANSAAVGEGSPRSAVTVPMLRAGRLARQAGPVGEAEVDQFVVAILPEPAMVKASMAFWRACAPVLARAIARQPAANRNPICHARCPSDPDTRADAGEPRRADRPPSSGSDNIGGCGADWRCVRRAEPAARRTGSLVGRAGAAPGVRPCRPAAHTRVVGAAGHRPGRGMDLVERQRL